MKSIFLKLSAYLFAFEEVKNFGGPQNRNLVPP